MKRRCAVPKLHDIFHPGNTDLLEIMNLSNAEATRTDRYLSWQELRYRKAPAELSNEQWWLGIKLHRAQARQFLPMSNTQGVAFSYASTGIVQQRLHLVDREAGGMVMTDSKAAFTLADRDKYLMTGIVEEAIMSSMLEGAAVTRSEARELLRSNRHPGNEHEQMVINNYRTMQMILRRKDEPLTPELIMALHHSMVEGTLSAPEKAGVLRTETDRVYIEDVRTGETIHTPPPAATLPERLEALCRFANGEDENSQYIHPAIRAIILHFQLAYDHPFVDGNGRTARSLFYWGMLHAGYWLFEYISISREIFRNSRSYYESFLNTEEDDNDLNYFIINQLDTILKSIDSLLHHVRDKQQKRAALQQALIHVHSINHRQREVLLRFLQHPNSTTSVTIHCKEFSVVRQTARTDLTALADMGLLQATTVSREHIFTPSPHLEHRLAELATP